MDQHLGGGALWSAFIASCQDINVMQMLVNLSWTVGWQADDGKSRDRRELHFRSLVQYVMLFGGTDKVVVMDQSQYRWAIKLTKRAFTQVPWPELPREEEEMSTRLLAMSEIGRKLKMASFMLPIARQIAGSIEAKAKEKSLVARFLCDWSGYCVAILRDEAAITDDAERKRLKAEAQVAGNKALKLMEHADYRDDYCKVGVNR